MDYICLEWSGSHCMHKQAKARWIWRHGSPESVWNLRAMTLLFRGQTTEFHMHKHLPFLPIASHKLVSVSYCLLISQATPFTDEACDTTTWKMETCWKEDSEEFFALFAVILQVSTCHLCALGALRECLLSNDANWQCQASHGWGEKWCGWNWTNWTGGYGAALSLSTLTEDAWMITVFSCGIKLQ